MLVTGIFTGKILDFSDGSIRCWTTVGTRAPTRDVALDVVKLLVQGSGFRGRHQETRTSSETLRASNDPNPW